MMDYFSKLNLLLLLLTQSININTITASNNVATNTNTNHNNNKITSLLDTDTAIDTSETIHYAENNVYPSNCINLDDGIYEMQLINDMDYPSVFIRCSNGYAIIDYDLDTNIKSYFSSWDYWHRATVGPSMDELVNWRQWYLPDHGKKEQSHNYLISPDCNSCDYVGNRQLYKEQTTYWMTGTFFGCYWRVKANSNCDMDYNTLECYTCLTDDRYINDININANSLINDDSTEQDYAYTGLCTHNVRRATHEMVESQEDCTTSRTDLVQGSQNLKPSLGTNGQYCVCTQPKYTQFTEYYTIDHSSDSETNQNSDEINENSENNGKTNENSENSNDEGSKQDKNSQKTSKIEQQHSTSKSDHEYEAGDSIIDHKEEYSYDHERWMATEKGELIELYQKDFDMGTYRIKKRGYYKIMEDIIFDFNPSHDDIYAPYSYWPMLSQADDYPGAQDYRDEYSMGFFAGITVEADYVTIDLNGHTLSMSNYFYLQQSWFTIIELSQQYFLPGQSFGFFGSNPHFSKHVVICNGVLGLSSHHGIHGNSNSQIVIKDLIIRDFNTHGIQLNGFDDIIVNNVEIGPSADISYFHGQWGIARVLLRRWQHIADETIGETIRFKNRDYEDAVTMQDIVNELTETMDYGWDYVINRYNIKNTPNIDSVKKNDNNKIDDSLNSGFSDDWESESQRDRTTRDHPTTEEGIVLLNEAKKLFLNPTGIPSAASIYGIFLNKYGASVFTYNLYSKEYSSKAVIEDVSIHGLRHSMWEWPYLIATTLNDEDGAGTATDEIKNPFFGPILASDLFNEFPDFENGYPSYKGNIIIDGYIASTKFMQHNIHSFKYLGQQCILSDVLVNWAAYLDDEISKQLGFDTADKEIDASESLGDSIRIGCNMDTMNHAGKGTLGIRIDSVDDVLLRNIEIYDNHDSTPLGTEACGNYDENYINDDGFNVKKTGHFRQTAPMQVGFSGNMNQGVAISASKNVRLEGDINIFDLTSETGVVYGIAIWPNADVSINGNININNLESGGNVGLDVYGYDDMPNRAPEVCGIRLYESYDSYISSLNIDDDTEISLSCLAGDYGCFGEADQFASSVTGEQFRIISEVVNHEKCSFRFENSNERIGLVDANEILDDSANDDNDEISDDIEQEVEKVARNNKKNEIEISRKHGNEDHSGNKDNIIDSNKNVESALEGSIVQNKNSEDRSLFGFALLYDNSGHTNIFTDVIWAVSCAIILFCGGYLLYRFCCRREVRRSQGYRDGYIRSRMDSPDLQVNVENDNNSSNDKRYTNNSRVPNYTPTLDKVHETSHEHSEYVSL